jgi:hypothetical protein
MNDNTKLQKIRELVKSVVLEVQPMAGEEMNLPQNDPHRDGFIDGERTLAAKILAILGETAETPMAREVEEEMLLDV